MVSVRIWMPVVLIWAMIAGGCTATGTHSAYVAAGERQENWFTQATLDPLKKGKKNFRNNNIGLAEKSFRKAVESSPRNAEAWLGLAASYDRLGRFDLADRAYDEAIRLKGPLPQILNNRGYSYYLRGNFKKARLVLAEAAKGDPENTQIQGNLELVETADG